MIKFRKYFVSNEEFKARVRYSIGNRIDGRKCVTLYAKDWTRELGKIFKDHYKNETDSMTDYFDEGKVTFFENDAHYETALKIASGE